MLFMRWSLFASLPGSTGPQVCRLRSKQQRRRQRNDIRLGTIYLWLQMRRTYLALGGKGFGINTPWGPFWAKPPVCPKRPKRAFRDDWPIPRKGRPLDSPIGLPYFLPAAGHVLAKILFYTGFTKRGGPPGEKAVFAIFGLFRLFATWESCNM